MANEKEELLERNIELNKTVNILMDWIWETDEELATLLMIPEKILWQYRNWKRRYRVKGNRLMAYIRGNFLEMQRLLNE